MNSIPLWLQIVGIIVALTTGIAGTALGIINLVLRLRDVRPRLLVEAKTEPTHDNKKRLVLVVRNKGRVSVTVDGLYCRIAYPPNGEREVHFPEIISNRNIPFRLEPGDRERFEVLLPFMFARLDAMGFEGVLDITIIVVDGVNNHYEAKPFSVNLENRPEPDRP